MPERYDQVFLDHLVDTLQALASGQWPWFVREWPGFVVLVQTRHWVGRRGAPPGQTVGLVVVQLEPIPRQSFTANPSGPLTRPRGFRHELHRWGIAHLFLAEEGFLSPG